MQGQTGRPTFAEALKVWLQIGLTSFGGPAGQIAMMHKVLVDQKRWLDERTYLLALNFCTLLPGPEAMQLATYAGWRLHGVMGGLAAGILFVLPGALVILALTALYVTFGAVPAVTAIFAGIKAAVLAIVLEALLRIAKRSLNGAFEWIVAAASFAAIFFLKVPFPIILLAAGLAGYLRSLGEPPAETGHAVAPVRVSQTVWTVLVWLAVWLLPLFALAWISGPDDVLTKLAVFFSRLAVVTFGGAYAVLAYMAQEAVETFGWLKPGEMLDGLGLAETTPGPLILVTEFVGFLAAARAGGQVSLAYGALGALVTLWATFAPCFLYIFAGAPYIEWLKTAPRLRAALSGITAAVVGVILNLSVWFALHVLFRHVTDVQLGFLEFPWPDLASANAVAIVLALLSSVLLFAAHAGIGVTLVVAAAVSLLISVAGV